MRWVIPFVADLIEVKRQYVLGACIDTEAAAFAISLIYRDPWHVGTFPGVFL
jgi:hypothetical protein